MPKPVWWFEKLMWISLLLGIVAFWVRWEASKAKWGVPDFAMQASIPIGVFTITVVLVLIFLIARLRQNWARFVFAALFILGLPFAVMNLVHNLPDLLSAGPTAIALWIVQGALQLAAMVLIYLPGADPWFTKPAEPAQGP